MTHIQELKRPLRAFLKLYPDDRLAALLAHAQDGKLAYNSCCCFIGSINADHALQGHGKHLTLHGNDAMRIHGAVDAERAYAYLPLEAWRGLLPDSSDEFRRHFIIPLIRAEMRIRERSRVPAYELLASVEVA